MTHVAVVGAGISGLAAALRLRQLSGPGLRITLVDQADRVGGKMRTGEVAGVRVEQGAEAFLLRDPVMAELTRAVAGGEVAHPAPLGAGIVAGGQIRPVPRGTLMGVPADPTVVDEALVPPRPERPEGHAPLVTPGADLSVGQLVRSRYGDEVVDRLVDPLLGGVYAGRADDLSLAATMPALHEAAQREHSLGSAVRVAQQAAPAVGGPVFGGPARGMSQLAEALAGASGADRRLGLPVRALEPVPGGWRLTVGSTRDPEHLDVDAVVLAVPARPAARLLSGWSPAAAAEIGVLDYASVALVTLVFDGDLLPMSSGFLVPSGEGYTVKAATFVTRKWPHLAHDSLCAVRLSVGRYRESRDLHRDDTELTRVAADDLAAILGVPLPAPTGTAVRRWGGGLPQYAPGHLGRVASAREALAEHPTLALAGAGYDGVGLPACARSGQRAAESLWAALAPPEALSVGETHDG